MAELDTRRLLAWGAAVLILALGGVWYAGRTRSPASPQARESAAISVRRSGGAGHVVVDVAGQVRRPGVYRLRAGARVEDALRRAGGPRRHADLAQINRAAKLEDGRQVLVPERAVADAAVTTAAAGATAPPAVPINLNTATVEQLDEIDGIGPTTAQKIVEYRVAHGGFGSVDELGEVPGIGDKRLAALREQVRV